MPAYPQTNMTLIQAALRHDYSLEATEVEILTDDVISNLKALWETIVNHGAPVGIGHFNDALNALTVLAETLRQERLLELAKTLAECREQRKSAIYRDALNALKQYIDGLDAAIAASTPRSPEEFHIPDGTRSAIQNHDLARSR